MTGADHAAPAAAPAVLGPAARWTLPAVAWSLLAVVLLAGWDEAVFAVLNDLGLHTGDWIWIQVTSLGDAAVVCALLAPWLARRPDLLRAVLVSALLVMLVTRFSKEAFGALRPYKVLGEDAVHVIGPVLKRKAFPSGHTTTAFTMAALVWHATRRVDARGLALLLALAMGVSRVAVGAHWPRDVLAGAGLGWLLAAAGWALASRWQGGLSRGAQGFGLALVLLVSAGLPVKTSDFDAVPAIHYPAAVLGVLGAGPSLMKRLRGAPQAEPSDDGETTGAA